MQNAFGKYFHVTNKLSFSFLSKQFPLSQHSLASLSDFAHLSELKLMSVHIDLATLDQARLKPLLGVRKLKLEGICVEVQLDERIDEKPIHAEVVVDEGRAFARLIQFLFPNATKWFHFGQVRVCCESNGFRIHIYRVGL